MDLALDTKRKPDLQQEPDCAAVLDRLSAAEKPGDATVKQDEPAGERQRWTAHAGLSSGADDLFAASLVAAIVQTAADRVPSDTPLGRLFAIAHESGLSAPLQLGVAATIQAQLRPELVPVVRFSAARTRRSERPAADGIILSAQFQITDASEDGRIVADGTTEWLAAASDAAPPPRPSWPQPPINHDNQFWWDGADAGKLLIQRCVDCSALRHPPGPSCPVCNSLQWDTVESSGKGIVYSYTVHHARFADLETPYVVVLVDLAEGVRIAANLVGERNVEIGMPVRLTFRDPFPGERRIPQFVRDDGAATDAAEAEGAVSGDLDALTIKIAPTMVAAAAITTGCRSPLHFDASHARKLGWRDVVLDPASALVLAEHYLRASHVDHAISAFSIKNSRPIAAGTALVLTGSGPDGDRSAKVAATSADGVHYEVEFTFRAEGMPQ